MGVASSGGRSPRRPRCAAVDLAGVGQRLQGRGRPSTARPCSPRSASRSWISWALRKSSKDSIAAATARRCRVGRSGCRRRSASVLVIVPSVGGVPVAVVDVVDVVAVLAPPGGRSRDRARGRAARRRARRCSWAGGVDGRERRRAAGAAGRSQTPERPGRPRSRPARAARSSGPGRRRVSERRPRCTSPPTEASVPSTIAAPSVVRNDAGQLLRRSRPAPPSARETSSSPTVRIATVTRDRGEHRDQQVVDADVEPGDPGELLVLGDREQLRRAGRRSTTTTTAASAIVTSTSDDGDRGDRAEQVAAAAGAALCPPSPVSSTPPARPP